MKNIEKKLRILEALTDNLERQKKELMLINCIEGSLKGYAGQILSLKNDMEKDIKIHRNNIENLELLYKGQLRDLNIYNLKKLKDEAKNKAIQQLNKEQQLNKVEIQANCNCMNKTNKN